MQSYENKAQSAISAGKLPGSVAVASNKTGSFSYAKGHGPHSLKYGSEPLKTDAQFWIASCSKLLTSIATMQCVKRGQFTLDEDVTRLLPELKDIDILTGFEPDSDTPILVKATKTIALRHLLTHTSGIAYDIFNPGLQRWRKSRGEVASLTAGTLIHRYSVPLLFEPGEGFAYSTGLDWAGLMIERTNNMTLEQYMQTYICTPLGIADFTFHIEKHPEMLSRLTSMTLREGGENPFGTPANPAGSLKHNEDLVWTHDQTDDLGGVGVYISMPSYQKILHSITISDGKLLSKSMNDELYRPQLTPQQMGVVNTAFSLAPMRDIMAPGLQEGTKIDYALGGMIVMEDIEGRRRKGTMHWAGLPNLYWWSDREAGVSGIYGSQLVPTADPQSGQMFKEFEVAVYEEIAGM